MARGFLGPQLCHDAIWSVVVDRSVEDLQRLMLSFQVRFIWQFYLFFLFLFSSYLVLEKANASQTSDVLTQGKSSKVHIFRFSGYVLVTSVRC